MKKVNTKVLIGLPDLAMIVTAACWGLNFVITKSAAGDTPEQFRIFIYNLIRFPVAAILLFITAKVRGDKIMLDKKYLGAVALLSFIGIFLYQILYMSGQNITESANIGIIYGFTPLLILIIAVIAGIERPAFFTVTGVIMGFIGLFLILFQGGKWTVDIGSFLMFLAVVCFACYAVFGKHILDKYPPVTTTAWMLLFGAIFQLPLALRQLPSQSWGDITGINIFFVLLATLLSQYTGYTLFYYSISRIGPARTGVYSNLTPVFTLIFAALIRHEAIYLIQIIGLSVIIGGICITKIRK
ncbi:MAG: EamA family transporter [Candidatus Latescibacteria bacterium]|nr:EamA family transporter [Candidatus Latescibacterota bacterium]